MRESIGSPYGEITTPSTWDNSLDKEYWRDCKNRERQGRVISVYTISL